MENERMKAIVRVQAFFLNEPERGSIAFVLTYNLSWNLRNFDLVFFLLRSHVCDNHTRSLKRNRTPNTHTEYEMESNTRQGMSDLAAAITEFVLHACGRIRKAAIDHRHIHECRKLPCTFGPVRSDPDGRFEMDDFTKRPFADLTREGRRK